MQGLRGNILEQAAQIAAARFASPYRPATPRALQIEVAPGDPIRGSLQWNSGDIPEGTSMLAGYCLGVIQGGEFYPSEFTVGTTLYVYGSRLSLPAPAPESSLSDNIPSYALEFDQEITLAALCFLASGTLSVYSQDFGSGSRVIGLRADHFAALNFYADRTFGNVLIIVPPTVPAEITGFNIIKS